MHRTHRALSHLTPVGIVVMGACAYFHPRTPPKSESVEFQAVAELIVPGDSLMRVRATATNSGTLTWTLEFGPCSMNIRVSDVAAGPTHTWDYERWRIATNPKAACVGFRVAYPLPPGGALTTNELERTVRVRDVLGDSLLPGRYRVTVTVGFSNQASVDVVAGEVELRRRH